MLIFIRIVTAVISYIIFMIITYFAICVIGGFIAGAIAGFQNPDAAANAGAQAGAMFVQTYNVYIVMFSNISSLLLSCWLSFFGIFPWCRKKA
jgi:uncharacterized membrane protein